MEMLVFVCVACDECWVGETEPVFCEECGRVMDKTGWIEYVNAENLAFGKKA